MRKRVLLALVLVMALLASTGCNLIVKDEAVDRATVIIEVGNKTYTKGEINDQLDLLMDYYAQMYAAYGMPFDANDEATVAEMRTSVINGFIDEAVVTEKITAGGFDQLSDEEMAEIEAKVDEDYQVYYDSVDLFQFGSSDLTGEERTKAIEAEMVKMGYPTREELLNNELLTAAQTKLREDVVKNVVVTDEELTIEYQARVDEAKASYSALPGQFGSDLTNKTAIYYTPAGYRYVKHVLISYAAEDQNKITDLESQISSKEISVATATENKEALSAELADLNAQLEEALANANAAIQPTVDEVAAKIAAGEDFNALIEAYNTDPGMTADAIGYPVSNDSLNWVESFKNGAMALANVGDVSDAVYSNYGVHFIKYESDIAEGPVALEDVKDEIAAELLTIKQDTFFNDTIDQWIVEANPQIHEKLL